MLSVNHLGLPVQFRHSLACTNSIRNLNGTARCVCRNVTQWRKEAMALRRTATAMREAAKGFRRLQARKRPTLLKAGLAARNAKRAAKHKLEDELKAA